LHRVRKLGHTGSVFDISALKKHPLIQSKLEDQSKSQPKEPIMPSGSNLCPLAYSGWDYISVTTMDTMRNSDWQILARQRDAFQTEHQAQQVLAMFEAQRNTPSFGYQINNYRHCLQSATLAYRDGLDEETVVVSLLHDIGFISCPDMHAEFAAALLGAYISEANHWMLLHHPVFQNIHVHGHTDPTFDRHARDRWRGHPHYDWTVEWVARYDQNAMDPDYDCLPLEFFQPMVHRLFERTPSPKELKL